MSLILTTAIEKGGTRQNNHSSQSGGSDGR